MSAACGSGRIATRIKMVTTKIGSGKTPTGGSETYEESGVLFLRSQNVYFDRLRLDDVAYISDETDREMMTTRVRVGDSLLNITGASLGRVARAGTEISQANVNQHVCIVRPSHAIDARYLTWCLAGHGVQQQIHALQVGGNRDGLNFEQVGNLRIPLVPTDEQRRIADFLDAETARIDRLVSLRVRQVDELYEALRSEAATATRRHQLSSPRIQPGYHRVPMRRILDKVRTGLTPTEVLRPTVTRDHLPWYTPAALGGTLGLDRAEKGVLLDDANHVPRFSAGSILIVGIGESLGKVADLDHEATGNQQLTAIKTVECVDRRFIAWQLFAAHGEIRNWSQYSRIRILNNDSLKSFPVSVPSIAVQVESRQRLDDRLAELTDFRAAAGHFFRLASERRQALISAAVTGQIDVTTARGVAV